MTGAKRIAITLQSLEGGGAQRRIVDLCNGFMREGRDVHLFLLKRKGDLEERLSRNVRLLGAEALADYLRNDPPGALLSGASAVHSMTVRALPQQRDFPLVLRASSHPLRRLPWSMPREVILEQLRRRKRFNAYRSADLIIAVADDVAEPLKRAFPQKPITVIPNRIVTEEFLAGASVPIAWPPRDKPALPLVVAIGRLALAKDFPTLLRAAAIARKTRDFHLALLGGGSADEKRRLFALAQDLGLAKDVTFVGECDHVAAWLSRASLFVSSSLWEGSPATIVEALAMGCPVIATDRVGSARELLCDPALGSLVPASDPKAMGKAIGQWLGRPHDKERLRAAAEPFRIDRAGDYLAAIDASVARMADRP